MTAYISLNKNEDNSFKDFEFKLITDNVIFDESDVIVAYYDLIKYIIHNMVLDYDFSRSYYDFLQEKEEEIDLKYFCLDKEDFLTKEEYLSKQFYERKNLMAILVPLNINTFVEYKEYIKNNRTNGETISGETSD